MAAICVSASRSVRRTGRHLPVQPCLAPCPPTGVPLSPPRPSREAGHHDVANRQPFPGKRSDTAASPLPAVRIARNATGAGRSPPGPGGSRGSVAVLLVEVLRDLRVVRVVGRGDDVLESDVLLDAIGVTRERGIR